MNHRSAPTETDPPGARVCGLEREVGTLEAGKLADLLVVGGNPLEDLDALRDVRLVLKAGQEIPSGSGQREGGVA